MAKTGRQRPSQRRDKHKRASSRREASPTTVDDVPDHLVEAILLRLDSSVSLLRAAAACKRWRRVVVDAVFLRSFRSLHGAHHVAGQYHTVDPSFASPLEMGISVFVPTLPSLIAGVESHNFSLNFLDDDSWKLVDSRGSLLLLLSKKRKSTGRWEPAAAASWFPDLVVCEPLTRRYQGIVSPVYFRRHQCLGVFLLDGDGETNDTGGHISMSNFRIIAVLHDHSWQHHLAVPSACVFTSGSEGGWHVVQSASNSDAVVVSLPERFDSINFAGRASGCVYWGIEDEDGAMLVLDENTMQFSIEMFPDIIRESYDKLTFRVVDSDDNALRVVRLMRNNELKIFVQLDGCGEWVVERLINLPEATHGLPGRQETFFQQEAKIVAASAAYVLLTPQEKKWFFSVELETGEVERDHARNRYAGAAYSYELPWPPTLQACSDYNGRRR